MGVQLVNDENPSSIGISVDQTVDMVDEINLGSGRSDGWSNDLPGGDVKVNHQTLCTVPDVLKLSAFDQTRFHRFGRLLALQSLNARFLIRADGRDSQLMTLWGLSIHVDQRGFNQRFQLLVGEPLGFCRQHSRFSD
jgi:hypothetical protein